MSVNPFDAIFIAIFYKIITEMFTQFIQLCCATNVFVTAKFIVRIFPDFSKH